MTSLKLKVLPNVSLSKAVSQSADFFILSELCIKVKNVVISVKS